MRRMGKKLNARVRPKRPLLQGDGVLYIQLSGGQLAIVDDTPEVKALVEGRNWTTAKTRYDGLFYAHANFPKPGGGFATCKLHRVIMPGHRIVDHINGNGLDCRLSNLRPCTHNQNRRNSRAKKGKPMKGAYLTTRVIAGRTYSYWQSAITIDNKRVYLGTFPSEQAAHGAWLAASMKVDPEFTCAGR